ncbi:MAG TPA: chromate efflux transporter, partial [Polyangiaceae bacterium]|nr:chromate efflux transporter [Polyangiaceae bacterium]
GPNSTELAIHIGWARRGAAGLVIAGVSFIVPAMLMTGACGYLYVRFGALPSAQWLLYGVKPVMLAVVGQAVWGLLPKAASTTALRVLGAAALVGSALAINELAVLFGSGFISVLWASTRSPARDSGSTNGQAPLGLGPLALADFTVRKAAPAAGAGLSAAGLHVTAPALFWVFLKIGSVLFGSGYVLLAFLRADLVERMGWLTEGQLMDAIAVGQVTPGPVFTTATFVGYVLAGPSGAALATLGIFLPAFVFVALSGPWVPRLRASRTASAFLDGVNVASLALMALVTVQLGMAAVIDVPTLFLALASAILLLKYRVNSTWLVALGAFVGWCVHAAGL